MTTELARKFALEVTNDTTLASGFVRVKGINDFDRQINPNLEDASDYDTDGWETSEVTMNSWNVAPTFQRRKNSGVQDPGQEMIRARVAKFGDAARIGVRWFDRTGGSEAWAGIALVSWKPTNTGVKNLETIQATLTGTDVALQAITNPFQATAAPVVTAVSPAGAGSGASVVITGTAFTGATAVKFGSTNATSFSVINDQLITAVLPSGAAGSAAVTVTTPNGSNATAFPYTRAA